MNNIQLGAYKGWVKKYQKKADFWEAEARRLGSTAEYNIRSKTKNDNGGREETPDLEVGIEAVMANIHIGPDQPTNPRQGLRWVNPDTKVVRSYENGMWVRVWSDPEAGPITNLCAEITQPGGIAEIDLDRDIEARNRDMASRNNPRAEVFATPYADLEIPEEQPVDDIIGRRVWVTIKGARVMGKIVSGIKNRPNHKYIYKAFVVDTGWGDTITEFAHKVEFVKEAE